MNIIDRTIISIARRRGFILGGGVVDRADTYFGKHDSTFSPEEYGNYIATSNGVYTCATGRADLLSSLPLKLYKSASTGDVNEVTTGSLYDLLQSVNPFWTMSRLIQMTELCLCLWGEAFWFLERGESGVLPPREVWWGKPSRVRVVPHPENYISGFIYEPATGGQGIFYAPGEVIWFRFPNPLDEYSGLAPLAAARLAADYAGAAMRSNVNLFNNGLQLGGALFPKQGAILTDDQAKSLEATIERRFKGVDKAHRWGVFRFEAEMQQFGVNPKDAEFLGGQKLALEDICRAYKWPLDLVGGQRTFENFNAAMRAAWTHAVLPEGRFISGEITEQLVPMFKGEADKVAFDDSDIDVLQEEETAKWLREKEQIQTGALLINEWRQDQGMEPVPWGNVWWAQSSLVPISDPLLLTEPEESEESDESEELDESEESEDEREESRSVPVIRVVTYNSLDHQRLWRAFIRRTEKLERSWTEMTVSMLERQKDAVLTKLKVAERAVVTNGSRAVTVEDVADEPFDMAAWVKKFRERARPELTSVLRSAGEDAYDDLSLSLTFDLKSPNVVRFIERRAQRFAREVNETTWQSLKQSLNDGIKAGESIPELSDRVISVMAERIRSTPETISRTEVVGGYNGGTLLAWEQSDVVSDKQWIAALDDRTRDTHADAHGQTVPLDEDFQVGDGSGPAPGQIGLPEEDINCRCSMTAVLKG